MIKHFVGETISVSLIEPMDEEPFVRIAKENVPGEYLDLDVKAWHEVQEVIGMMEHGVSMRMRGPAMLLNALAQKEQKAMRAAAEKARRAETAERAHR